MAQLGPRAPRAAACISGHRGHVRVDAELSDAAGSAALPAASGGEFCAAPILCPPAPHECCVGLGSDRLEPSKVYSTVSRPGWAHAEVVQPRAEVSACAAPGSSRTLC